MNLRGMKIGIDIVLHINPKVLFRIVGWVLDIPGNTLEISREMEETHRRNFISKYQFFFLMDSQEREEAFNTWKEGRLARKEGDFIYYEKNPGMQEYMISKREDNPPWHKAV